MNTEKQDRRVLRTKACIRRAFMELMEEKEFAKITVMELSERAGINRKTFYTYYDGMESLISQIETEILEKYRPLLESIDLKNGTFDALVFFREFNRNIEQDIGIFQLLDDAGRLPQLSLRGKNIIIDTFLKQFHEDDEARYALFAEYASAGLLSMFSQWVSSRQISLEEFTSLAAGISLAGFGAIPATGSAGSGK